jgi:hypothetical protein
MEVAQAHSSMSEINKEGNDIDICFPTMVA